jgi:large subunit ribosomal protein L43
MESNLLILFYSEYLKKDFVNFAKANPQIEFVVEPRAAHHPIIRGHYCECSESGILGLWDCTKSTNDLKHNICFFLGSVNGREKVICVRNMEPYEIKQKVQLLKDSSGAKLKNLAKRPVISTTESDRGIWSPFHTNPHKI